MPRLHASRHAVPAVLVTALSLLAPLFGAGAEHSVTGTAGSATARAAVITPVEAPAVRFAVGSVAMVEARRLAEQHWGTSPCGGNVDIAWTQLEADTNATAAWRNPTDAWNNAGANFDCRIEFNVAADYDWPKLCTVMTHEMGHLVGQPHSERAGELMSPLYTEPLPACTGGEPGAPAAAPEPVEDEEFVVRSVVTKKKPRPSTRRLRAAGGRSKTSAKRCTRSFRAGRKASRCGRSVRSAARRSRR